MYTLSFTLRALAVKAEMSLPDHGHFRLTELASDQNCMKHETRNARYPFFSIIHLSIKAKTEKTSRYPFFILVFGLVLKKFKPN